ncbi:MAG: membrane protein insertase YidC [Deltaproteobacteria bacterium]|jgi:YidC/Oxa1 family membrane protein insertase|nr:membrane protein insertase YidC [Deltaproteobacteria bacterium]MBW2534864.1 membrane protein insertase YidC [Deltaproteobacteria bacterium]
MDRSSILRWVLIGVAVFLLIQFGLPLITGEGKKGQSELQPLGPRDDAAPAAEERKGEGSCQISGPRFSAELSTRGASLRHVVMKDEKYSLEVEGERAPIDLVTTTLESRMPLRTDFRAPEGTEQVQYNDFDWEIASQTPNSCAFSYRDDSVEITKEFRTTDRPFEIELSVTLKNQSAEAQKHRLAVEQTDWRTQKEMAGSMGRVSEFMTETTLRAGGETVRFEAGDFEPDDFSEPDFTVEKWRRAPGEALWAAVSSSYFSKAIIHLEGPASPFAESQIEEVWDVTRIPSKEEDPNFGHVFRARLSYPEQELEPEASASYKLLAYAGPKERAVLAEVGGSGHDATELLDMGIFGAIGKILIGYLYVLYGLVGVWGWAICLLTITVKIVLFPLSISQIKSSMAMRRLKPQMDELNQKYKDDPQQKGLALQELWRKNNVTNPMLGCLPVLLQMPVWFALYQALNSAVELYHTPFGPFMPDLAAPGEYYIIPILLGASSFLQQKLMPMQGDPAQQKMMLYLMPGIFMVFMLFLPAGLGVYFLTNTWLSILQQLAVEKYYKSRTAGGGGGDPKSQDDDAADDKKPRPFGRGKGRVQQRG